MAKSLNASGKRLLLPSDKPKSSGIRHGIASCLGFLGVYGHPDAAVSKWCSMGCWAPNVFCNSWGLFIPFLWPPAIFLQPSLHFQFWYSFSGGCFKGKTLLWAEMKPISKADANLALSFIFLLMITLLGLNIFYVLETQTPGHALAGAYPISEQLAPFFAGMDQQQVHFWHEFNWWFHILLIFVFANILPYSKHFHVFMSVPNVFVSKIGPLGKVDNMESITMEVKLMMDPNAAFSENAEAPPKFGVSDAEDVNWVNYMNALSCTECGRCTAVCPANITGKLLSPRKIMMDVRARMKEKGPGLMKEGAAFNDNKSLLGSYITEEELWACTMCNACAQECPVNINQPAIILDMRRYLVLEKSAAPAGLNTAFTNIENNGAPWQFSQQDRMNWAEDLFVNKGD